jgi:hypothetical protein
VEGYGVEKSGVSHEVVQASAAQLQKLCEKKLMVLGSYSNTQADWRKLISVCLQLHEYFVSPAFPNGKEKAINLICTDKNKFNHRLRGYNCLASGVILPVR